MMQNRPDVSFRCGPLALGSILAYSDPTQDASPLVLGARSSTNGFSMSQLARLSLDLGMNYQMAFRSPGAGPILPAVVHWKAGHYASVLRKDGDRFLIHDHTFRAMLRMSAAALEEEASGYFLVPPGPLPTGWRPVSDREGGRIWARASFSTRTRTIPLSRTSSWAGPLVRAACVRSIRKCDWRWGTRGFVRLK